MKLSAKIKNKLKTAAVICISLFMALLFVFSNVKIVPKLSGDTSTDGATAEGNENDNADTGLKDACGSHGEFYFNEKFSAAAESFAANSDEALKTDKYLSDITSKCQPNGYLPYGVVADKTDGGAKLSVKVEGVATYFDKGLYTPTPKSVIYDISEYEYKYFFSNIAVQSGTSAKGRAVFSVDFSNSATSGWVNKFVSGEMTSNDSAKQIRVETGGYKYIRIRADFAEGTRTSAAAVWADAKFTDSDTTEVEYLVKSVAEYDRIIKTKYANADLSDANFELALLQRNFVSKFGTNGHAVLHNYLKSNNQNVEAFSWLFDNLDVLRMYTTGGTPDNTNIYLKNNTYNPNSWLNSLKVLNTLYNTYKDDLNDNTVSPLGNRRRDIYQKMMISIALTYSKRVRFWIYDMGADNSHWADGEDKYFEGDILSLEDDLSLTAVFIGDDGNTGGDNNGDNNGDNSGDNDNNGGNDNTGNGDNTQGGKKGSNTGAIVAAVVISVAVAGAAAVTGVILYKRKKSH